MSYCVNCGVKLSSSEKKCPLCKTPVINPNLKKVKENYSYPTEVETFSINWRYLAKLIILVFLVLALISLVCDFIITRSVTWSYYVIGIVIFICSLLTFFMFKKKYIPLTILLLSAEVFALIISWLNNGLHSYLYLILPFLLIIYFYVLFCFWLFKKRKKNTLRTISVCLTFCSLTLILIECLIDLYNSNTVYLTWSIYAVLPMAIISASVLALSFNRKLIEEIKQRIFI